MDLYVFLLSSKNRKFSTLKSTCLCPHVSTSIIISFLLNISHISGDFSLFVDLVISPCTFSNANFSAHAPSDLSYLFVELLGFIGRYKQLKFYAHLS